MTEAPAPASPAEPEHRGHAHGAAGHPPGSHAAHRFENAEAWAAHFEAPSRDAWQKPDIVLEALELARNAVVADVGSGTGYFAVRIARRVPEGRVWAVDIEPDMVRYVNLRAHREGHKNLFSILAAPDDPLVPELLDRMLLVNTYHHLADRRGWFRRAARYMKPGGFLVVVEFKMGKLPVGPPDEAKVPPELVDRELAEAGWALRSADAGRLPHQWVRAYTPPRR
jgi:SAM-dependent methyltransferase